MRDREAINRFVAFSLIGWQNYTTGDMDSFLAKGLKLLASCSDEERTDLRRRFDFAMSLSHRLFKRHAFRKSLASGQSDATRSVINISLFEVSAVVLSRCADGSAMDEAFVHDQIVDLLRDDTFAKSITYSTNSTQPVHERFRRFEMAMSELLS